jgi:tetratricopeptide (TPR) repeat protein
MPFLQHGSFGNQVRFARSDHTISIPRPAYDAALGLEGACAGCHANRKTAWLQKRFNAWYRPVKPHPPMMRALQRARTTGDPRAIKSAFLRDYSETHSQTEFELLRLVSALIDIAGDVLDAAVVEKIELLTAHKDLDIQALALAYLYELEASGRFVEPGTASQAFEHSTGSVALRRRLSLLITLRANTTLARGNLKGAAHLFQIADEMVPNQASVALGLASIFESSQRWPEALAKYQEALTLELPHRSQHLAVIGAMCRLYRSSGIQQRSPQPEMERVCVRKDSLPRRRERAGN